MVMHPAFPPEDSNIEVFLPTKPGQLALALINSGEAKFTFRAETPLAAKNKAKTWLQSFWSDRRAGKHKRESKVKTLADATPPETGPELDGEPNGEAAA